MKDHRKAEVVNEITDLALRYAGTQQLREHMSRAINAYLREQDRDTRHACADSVNSCEEVGVNPDKASRVRRLEAVGACMNAKAI